MVAIADPVSMVLGIRASGPLPLMSAVEKGLPLTSLDRVVHSVAPSDNKFAFRIIARATLARRRKALATAKDRADGRLSAEEGTRLARLASVWAMALDVWGSGEAARRFMFDAHPLLHGRRPVDVVLENEFGRPVVEGILGRLQYGSAV
jgi:putative toxin-antitoxin system antitoxin component (TIGR02293 family)